jgi:heme/copper-type cytochrome/quinol oxidase subunit 3
MINSLRGCTLSPINILKRRSADAASSIETNFNVRVAGFIVVYGFHGFHGFVGLWVYCVCGIEKKID